MLAMGDLDANRPPVPNSFASFWPYYMAAHQSRKNRVCHYVGSTGVLLALVLGIFVHPLWFFAAPVFGYGCAWFGHLVFEKNRPATWVRPWWSLIGDWKMYGLWLAGRLQPELERARGLPDIVELVRSG